MYPAITGTFTRLNLWYFTPVFAILIVDSNLKDTPDRYYDCICTVQFYFFLPKPFLYLYARIWDCRYILDGSFRIQLSCQLFSANPLLIDGEIKWFSRSTTSSGSHSYTCLGSRSSDILTCTLPMYHLYFNLEDNIVFYIHNMLLKVESFYVKYLTYHFSQIRNE